MKTFLMICHVAVDFVGPGNLLFRITPNGENKIHTFVQAPEWIKDTLIFKLLRKDGSIVIAQKQEDVKALENNPVDGIGADGKTMTEAPVEIKPAIKTRTKKTVKGDA